MICKNCGGEYEDSGLYCPYCKSENPKAAEEKKEETLERLDEHYRKEENRLSKELPKKVVKKGTKYTIFLIGGLLLLLLLIVAGILLIRAVVKSGSKNQLEKDKIRLESYFEVGDYEAMSSYLHETAGYDVAMKKYRETAEVYDAYTDWVVPMSDEWQSQMQGEWGRQNIEKCQYMLEYMLEYAGKLLQKCEVWCHDTAFLGNEEVLSDFARQTETLLRETYFLTEEQIAALKETELFGEKVKELADSITEQYMQNMQ